MPRAPVASPGGKRLNDNRTALGRQPAGRPTTVSRHCTPQIRGARRKSHEALRHAARQRDRPQTPYLGELDHTRDVQIRPPDSREGTVNRAVLNCPVTGSGI
jgi:hypothetical protein